MNKNKRIKIYHFNMQEIQIDNFNNVCNLTIKLLELPADALESKSRKHEYQVARSVASCVSRMLDGTHQNVIAKRLKRDRTLIYHYDKKHNGDYKSFPLYRKAFDRVYNAYSDIQNARLKFRDINHLQDHIKKFGIRHSSGIINQSIRIKAGDLVMDIMLSYKDFYNQLELCKLALRDTNAQYIIR